MGRRGNLSFSAQPVSAGDGLGVAAAEPGVRFERRDLNVDLGLRMGSSGEGFYHDCKNSEVAAQGTSTIDKLSIAPPPVLRTFQGLSAGETMRMRWLLVSAIQNVPSPARSPRHAADQAGPTRQDRHRRCRRPFPYPRPCE